MYKISEYKTYIDFNYKTSCMYINQYLTTYRKTYDIQNINTTALSVSIRI
jgi:hypothetical protein